MFLHQYSLFLVSRLDVRLFYGSWKLGSKTAKLVTENILFVLSFMFISAGCISSPIIAIFCLQACYDDVFWKFINDFGRIPRGRGQKLFLREKKTSLPRGLLSIKNIFF